MATWDYFIFWKEAKDQLKNELSEQEFTMWFNMEYDSSQESIIVLAVPSAFFKDQVKQKYQLRIEQKLFELSGQHLAVDFCIKELKNRQSAANDTENQKNSVPVQKVSVKQMQAEQASHVSQHPLMRSDYTFDTFVVGDNNSFAYNAGLAIASNPGKTYNPFLIYGGVGLGKTHLMEAVGNAVHKNSIGKKKIIYVTAENFTNEFIESIRDKKQSEFKKKYRYADVLLIDDIHFLQKKIETQEELFHTFNTLYDANKQIMFTCDRPISELKDISERLRSRFERGLSVDLLPPNYETRCAILNKKLEEKKVSLPQNVIDLIAKNIQSNVRDLEGSLTKLLAYTDITKKIITLEIAQQQLRDVLGSSKQGTFSIETIQKIVADSFAMSYMDLKSKKRTRSIAFPRQIAMYIVHEMTEFSFTEIGLEFGGRDHSTVMHSCNKIQNDIQTDSSLDTRIQNLIRQIKDVKNKS